MLTGERTGTAGATGGTVQAPAQEITEGIGTTITPTTTTAAVEVGRVDGGVAETVNGNETEKETLTALYVWQSLVWLNKIDCLKPAA